MAPAAAIRGRLTVPKRPVISSPPEKKRRTRTPPAASVRKPATAATAVSLGLALLVSATVE